MLQKPQQHTASTPHLSTVDMLQKPQHLNQHPLTYEQWTCYKNLNNTQPAPLTYQQWTCYRNLNISTSTPSPMNSGHAAETSTLQSAPPHLSTVDMLQKPQHLNQHPLTYENWTCCKNLNISTSTPSPMKTGHAAETSTLQPAPPHLSTVDMLQKPQHLNQHPLTYENWTCCKNLNISTSTPSPMKTGHAAETSTLQSAPLTYQQWTCYKYLNISTSTPSPMNSGHATKTSTTHSQHPSPINSGHATETSTSQPVPPHL